MSLFPNESYSFPDLTDGANKKRGKKEPMPPENAGETDTLPETSAAELAANQPEPLAAKPIVPPVRVPQAVRPISPVRPAPIPRPISTPKPPQPAHQARPVMPVIPVVPDQLANPPMDIVPDQLTETPMETVPDQLAELPIDQMDQEELESYPTEIVDVETDPTEPEEEFQAEELENRVETKSHRRGKLVRFVVFEALTIAVLLASAKMAVMERYSENSLSGLYGTIVVLSAIAAAVIPVIFFGLPPTLPTDKR